MAFEFVPVQASEQAALTQFLLNTFHADPSLISFRPDVMHWKYFAPHPDWSAPRSWAVRQEGQIVAHGGVWPVRLKTPKGEVQAIHLIDWAASRSAVGAGVYLLRKIAGLAEVLLTIGGSPDTRNLIPKLGYKRHGELRQYARVIRPWLHFRTTPVKNWKSPIKLLRNTARDLAGIPRPSKWRAQKIQGSPETVESVLTAMATLNATSSLRTVAGLNHFLSCPAANFSAFQVLQEERPRGYFLLAQIGNQARIVDLRLQEGDRNSWQALCNLAARTAAGNPQVCEIVGASSIPAIQDAWLHSGFVQRQTDPIFVYDPRAHVIPGLPLDLSLADGDLAFLSDPRFPYLL